MTLLVFAPIIGLGLFAILFPLLVDAKWPIWMLELGDRVKLAALKRFRRDRPVVAYTAVKLVNGSFRTASIGPGENIFGSNRIRLDKSRDHILDHSDRYEYMAEALLYGAVEETSDTYWGTDYRVLQIVSMKTPPRTRLSKSKVPDDLQPRVDQLQEKSGSRQPVRYVAKLEDFESTVIEPSKRAKRRALKVSNYLTYYSFSKSFYAEDDLTVAPGLYPVLTAEKRGNRLKGSKSSRSTSLKGHLETLQSRITETAGQRLQKTLKLLLIQLSELTAKASDTDAAQAVKLLETKHSTSVQRLLELSSREYYGSFFRNPENWSDPQRMALQVELSAITLTRALTEDLRRLNSPRELEFQINVRSLVGRNTESRATAGEASVDKLFEANELEAVDLQGDLESLRAAVEAEEAALLKEQSRPKSIKQLLLG